MERRTFIKSTSLALLAIPELGRSFLPETFTPKKNALPQWRGFNLTDFNTTSPSFRRKITTAEHLKWMQDWGFDFVRLPLSYPYYIQFDRGRDIKADDVYHINEQAVEEIERLVFLAHKHGLHVSLNLHRAPGYCINAGFKEPYNLWKDKEAQDAFCFHWNFWARRFKNIGPDKISFDLLNEPCFRDDMNDQHSPNHPIPVSLYHEIALRAVESIRRENKAHLIIADGNNVGNDPVPEMADLKIGQSCRGYFPHGISHYRAPWASSNPQGMPRPVYPGRFGDQEINRERLEAYYQPWIDLKNAGVGVHCGECGSWNKTPHDVFLSWFGDVLDILGSHQIGFALWEFIGDFGILNSGRADVDYEDWHGHQLDRKLLTLISKK